MLTLLKRIFLSILTGIVLLGTGGAFYLFQTEIIDTRMDPSGNYRIETSARRIDSALPRMPGQSSDLPVFVEIFDKQNRSLGRLFVPMRQMAYVEFTENGARIESVGSWNFKQDL